MTPSLEGNQKPWDAVHDFDYRGFKCTVVRYTNERPNLAREFLEGFIAFEWWCGYVEIPKENKFYQKHYDEIDIECHGGLTFSGNLHVSDSNNSGKYCIGFDFNHGGDGGGDRPKVEFECKKIVDQLLEVSFQ